MRSQTLAADSAVQVIPSVFIRNQDILDNGETANIAPEKQRGKLQRRGVTQWIIHQSKRAKANNAQEEKKWEASNTKRSHHGEKVEVGDSDETEEGGGGREERSEEA